MKHLLLPSLCLMAFLLGGGCASEEAVSPEEQIRALITQAELDAEARQLDGVGSLISDEYEGPRGENKETLLNLMQFYFIRHQSIHLLTRIEEITFDEPARAEVSILVGMAGRAVESAEEFGRLRGDVYRISCTFSDEGGGAWKITRASWQRALTDDIL